MIHTMKSSLTLIFAALVVTPVLGDWNQFRGPNGSGVGEATGLPNEIADDNTLWKIELGHGWSSPSLWGNKVVVTAESGPGRRAVMCLNAEDGSELWSHEVSFSEHQQHKFNSFASSTPFIDDQRIYVTWTSGNDIQAMALDHSGNVLWERTRIANYVHEHGSGASPVVVDGVLVIRSEFLLEKKGRPLATEDQMGWENCLVGLDAATGETKWKKSLPHSLNSFGTPVVREVAGGKKEFLIANTSSGFLGVDPSTGETNWQHNPGFSQRSVGVLALKDDLVFGSLGSGGGGKESAVLKLTPSGLKGPAGFEIDDGLPYVPSPLVVGDHLYLLNDGGLLSCVEFDTGKVIYDKERMRGKRGSTKYFSSPVYADGKIFCGSQTGELLVVKEGEEFEILGISTLDSPINATPAVGKDRLFVRTEKMLWCIGGKGSPVLP
jgi:outer membrane protein assembly factor BamB